MIAPPQAEMDTMSDAELESWLSDYYPDAAPFLVEQLRGRNGDGTEVRSNPRGYNQYSGKHSAGATSTDSKAGNTQINRHDKVSVPTKAMVEQGLVKGDVLHHGAGKAQADTELMKKAPGVKSVTEFDPFPNPALGSAYGAKTSDTRVLTRQYDTVVSNYVLNVLPPPARAQVLGEIARTTKPGGQALISVRPATDINPAQIKTGVGEADGIRVTGSKGTFQKGFTQQELIDYVSTQFTDVQPIKGVGGVGVIARGPIASRSLDSGLYDWTGRSAGSWDWRYNPEGWNQWTGKHAKDGIPGTRPDASLYPVAAKGKKMAIEEDLKLSHFTDAEQAEMTKKFESEFNVSQKEAEANMLAIFDQARTNGVEARYANWYDEAHGHASQIASQNNLRPQVGNALLAATSPGQQWKTNLVWAQQIAATVQHRSFHKVGDTEALAGANKVLGSEKIKPGQRYRDLSDRQLAVLVGNENHLPVQGYDGPTKGVAIARANDPSRINEQLNGAKVRSFYNNISNPGHDGDVTIDRHMLKAMAMGTHRGQMQVDRAIHIDDHTASITSSPSVRTGHVGVYAIGADAVRNVTVKVNAQRAEQGLPPYKAHQVQAIIWGQQNEINWPLTVMRKAKTVRLKERGLPVNSKLRRAQYAKDRKLHGETWY